MKPHLGNNRDRPDNIYCATLIAGDAKPSLIVIRFDQQLVLVQFKNTVLLGRVDNQAIKIMAATR